MKKLSIFHVSVFMLSLVFISSLNQTAAMAQQSAVMAPASTLGWAKSWGGSASDSVHNTVVDATGNVYTAGEFSGTVDFDPGSGVSSATSNGSADIFLSKLDANGNFQWVRTWGGTGRDVANGLGLDKLGYIYITGPFQNTVDFNPDPVASDSHASNAGGMNNIFLSQFDANGNFKWARTWGPTDGGAESYSLAVNASNQVHVVGDFSGSNTNFNPWNSKSPDWHANHPGSNGYIGPVFDSFISKFDANGNFIWARTWGGEGYDDGPGVAVDNLGNVYVGGMYASKNINFDPAGTNTGAGHPAQDSGYVVDIFLSKFDSNGNFLWVQTWGGQGTDDAAESVTVDHANNVYITGRFKSTNCDFDPGSSTDLHSSNGDHDVFVSKFSSNGSFLWAKTWGGTGWDASGSLGVDTADNLYSTGIYMGTVNFNPGGTYNLTANGGKEIYLSKFDSNGAFQWAQSWGGSGDDFGMRLSMASDNTLYLAGFFSSTVDFDSGNSVDNHTSNGSEDAFLFKLIALDNSTPQIFTPTSTIVSPTVTKTALSSTITKTARPLITTKTSRPLTATNTTRPPTATKTVSPATATNTTLPLTAPKTAIPLTVMNTALPPTATKTALPPTATNTTLPPTATKTALPPTTTNTALPPTATNTVVPPTATSAPAEAPRIPILYSPEGNITTSNPTYLWENVNAEYYLVSVKDAATGRYLINNTLINKTACNISTNQCAYTPTWVLPTNQLLQWQVSFGPNAISPSKSFTILP